MPIANLKVTLRGLIIESIPPWRRDTGNLRHLEQGVAGGKLRRHRLRKYRLEERLGGLVVDTSGVVGSVVVSDCVFANNRGSGISHGNYGFPTNSNIVIEHCRVVSNTQGVAIRSRGRGTVRNSVITNNTDFGIKGGGVDPSDVRVNAEDCTVADNGVGIFNWAGANVTVSNTAITGNTTRVTGSPQTYGNNQLVNNTSDGTIDGVVTQK